MTGACARCGEVSHLASARFCHRCGVRFAPGLPGPDALQGYTPPHLLGVLDIPETDGGERKDVTVLFVDVVRSLALTTALDPEDLHSVMDGLFALAGEAVHAEGGVINQYRGDGFMALFGAPRALPDHPARACRAALALRDQVARYAAKVQARHGQRLRLRCGVNTGQVWVGSIGPQLRKDYTAEGPTVGAAARIEKRAKPGQILVGGATHERCAAFFEWRPCGEQALRGLPHPVAVWELLRTGPHRQRLDVERARGPSPLTGRSQELASLAAMATPERGVRCVEVCGEAGVGKSRLALEHARGLGSRVCVLVLEGRESGQGRAWLAWIELLRRWPPDAPAADAAAALLEGLEGRGAPAGDVSAQVTKLLESVLARRPILLIVDDCQWLDPSSRQQVRRLDWREYGHGLAILALLRSDGRSLWEAGARVPRLALAPLAPEPTEALARTLLGSEAHGTELAPLMAARSQGNPLFLEELVRSIREGSPSLLRSARLEASLRREAEHVPATLRDVIAARIDSLPAASKRAVEAAALLARPFDLDLIQRVEPGAEERVADLLDRSILRPSGPGQLDLSHALIREVAYEQLVRPRRRELHARAARALASRPENATPDGAARIASHLEQAGDAEAAIAYLLRAGRQYAALDSPDEAAALLARALAHLQRAPGRDAVRMQAAMLLATCLNSLDRSEEAAAVLETIDVEAVGPEDQHALGRTLIQAGWVRFSAGNDVESGRALIERGLAAIGDAPVRHRDVTLGHSYLARMLLLDGDVAESACHARRVVAMALARADATGEMMGLFNLTHALCEAGRLDQADASSERARELSREREDDILVALAEIARARVELCRGEEAPARVALSRGLAAAERSGQLGLRYQAHALTGYLHLLLDQPREAHTCFERLTELNESWPITALHRARGFLEVGDTSRAMRLAERCLEKDATRMVRARGQAVLGFALGLESPPGDPVPERLLSESLSACEGLGLRPYVAEALQFLAELMMRAPDLRRAHYYAQRSARTYEACGMPVHAELARSSSSPP